VLVKKHLIGAMMTVATITGATCAFADDAASLPDTLRRCGRIAVDQERLACYDGLATGRAVGTGQEAKRPDAPAQQSAAVPAPADAKSPPPVSADATDGEARWANQEDTSGLDHSKTQIAALPATKGYVGNINRAGLRRGPILVIRCRERQTQMYVSFDTSVAGLGGEVPVQYRVGDRPVVKAVWGGSQDHDGYGVWSSTPAILLIKALLDADEFFVRADERIMGSSEALFQLKGISAAVKPVRDACGW
jgi:type VI secretion system VasI family protein